MSEMLKNSLFQDIVNHIRESRIKKAISLLSSLRLSVAESEMLHAAEQTYSFICRYLIEGVPDENRHRMLSSVKEQLFLICDSVRRSCLVRDSSSLYYSTARNISLRSESLAELVASYRQLDALTSLITETVGNCSSDSRSGLEDKRDKLDEIFERIWTSAPLSSSESSFLKDILFSNSDSYELKAQIISALTFALLQFYDKEKLLILISLAESPDDSALAARALPGVMFVLRRYSGRVGSDISLDERFGEWPSSDIMIARIRTFVKEMLRSRNTDKVADKMRNEVLPKIMEMRPEIMKRLRNMSVDADVSDLSEPEANPDWEEALEKNGILDKLKEMGEMQSEGDDIMMVAFQNLKDFPFFRKVSHWTLPFSPTGCPEICNDSHLNEMFASLISSHSVMCDSDKYSFLLTLDKVPQSQRSLMEAQLNSQFSNLKEQMDGSLDAVTSSPFDNELRCYMRDLFRFYRLFPRRSDFYSPFEKPIDFLSLPFISTIMNREEEIVVVSEFYFHNKYFSEAIPYLIVLSGISGHSDVYEKIGFCCQSLGEFKEALEWYEKSLLVNGESQWLVKKIAQCSKMTHDYHRAATYYLKALDHSPESVSIILNAANSLFESGETSKAKKLYYKANYLQPDNLNSSRAIMWCEMYDGNLDKAFVYAEKLLGSEAQTQDLLNIGHLHIMSGNFGKGAEFYGRVLNLLNGDKSELRKEVISDLNMLPKLSSLSDEVGIVLDTL